MSEVTTPSAPTALPTKPQRKWLGGKGGWFIFGGVSILWLFNLLFNVFVLGHPGFSPNSIILGGLGMTAAFLYTLAYRVRPTDGLSIARLLIAFGVGGFISTELAVPLEYLIDLIPSPNALAVHALAGIVEEACKLFAVVIVSRGLVKRTVRNGLFIGGAVGLGFAALEDMKYAVAAFDTSQFLHNPTISVIGITLLRDVLGPFEHPIFTALLAATLFAASRRGRFRINGTVIGVYLAVSAAHGLIDAASILLDLAWHNAAAAGAVGFILNILIIVANAIVWFRVSRRANAIAAVSTRPAGPDDLDFLTHTLVATANWDRDRGVTFDSVKQIPEVWHYLEGWQRPTDFGFVAVIADRPVGAGWGRFLSQEDAGYGFVDAAIPELTLAVIPDARKRRVGRTILASLIQAGKDRGLAGLSLSVEDGNVRARRLYEKAGFRKVGRVGNSDTLLLRFEPQPASPVGSGAVGSLSSAPPMGSPSQ